jgi:tRNA nucleotidyltransferase (CCA-adding enzyme)
MDNEGRSKADRIFERVLSEIKPSKEETAETIAHINAVMARLKLIVDPGVDIRVVGSVARGTNMRGYADIDIFVLFDKNSRKEDIVKRGLRYGRKLASGKNDRLEIKYAEHPYTRIWLDDLGLKIDLVPALKIGNARERGTAVDRTPLHNEFINANLTDKQRDDTRVLKYLLKSHNLYGAEVKIGGFPGYLCELLIHQFGSLFKALEFFSIASSPIILDPGTRNSTKDESLVKKFNSNFIVIDPVDGDRNVAAGVSRASLSRFILLARMFLQKPSAETFYGRGFSSISAKRLVDQFVKQTGSGLYLIETTVPDKSEDVVWPQLKKNAGLISNLLARYGYEVYLSAVWVKARKGYLLFSMPDDKIPAILRKGPEVFMRKAAENFMRSHHRPIATIVRDSTLCFLESNPYPSATALFKDVLSGKLLGSKRNDVTFKGARLFAGKIPKNLAFEAYSEMLKKITI